MRDLVRKKKIKKRIEEELEKELVGYRNNTPDYADFDEDNITRNIIKRAKYNNYRGNVETLKSPETNTPNANKFFIRYKPKNTFLQDLGAAAGAELRR